MSNLHNIHVLVLERTVRAMEKSVREVAIKGLWQVGTLGSVLDYHLHLDAHVVMISRSIWFIVGFAGIAGASRMAK